MATATLLATRAPGPVIGGVVSNGGSAGPGVSQEKNSVTTVVNVTSVSLAAGTWCVSAYLNDDLGVGDLTGYLSGASGTATNISPVTATNGGDGYSQIVSCIVVLTGTTTIYLNAASSAAANIRGYLWATQIQCIPGAVGTLIDPSTPGPALGVTIGANGTSSMGNVWLSVSSVTTVVNIGSISLPKGTHVVSALITNSVAKADTTGYLSGTSGAASNYAPLQRTDGSDAYSTVISSIITVAATTTIYLNAASSSSATISGYITASQVD